MNQVKDIQTDPGITGSSPGLSDDPLWFKDAIVYELHVKAFRDNNGDGYGDFAGLTSKLDYLVNLGVNTLWLLPFYPSPMRDDGYDISDYHNVHPDYGTRKDFRKFVQEAHRRGLRVITELVINHTSDQHPWFQAARKAKPGSAKRDYYVWSDTDQKFPETRIIFTDTENSNWAWDPEARAYYWHRFFSHQPDLNHNNPQVVNAVTRLMRFWLDLGVDGLRLDAIPYLCVREGTANENLRETHDVIKQMRAVVDKHYKNRVFLAEANQWPEDTFQYFGTGDECHMAYHFPLMPRMYMAVALEDRHPIVEIMQQTPDIPDTCQWAIFLRNHDELTLEMVTEKERDYMYKAYAGDQRMRLNVGIRRRLAPLMDNNRGKIELMNSLLFSMPGSPIIYYGDEIGMGDNIFLGDRNGVRTPMQWSPDRNAGFSRADPARLYMPPIMDSVYGYEAINVESQERNSSSLLNWMQRLIKVRKSYQAFSRGNLIFMHPGNRKILAYLRILDDNIILCVANLSRFAQPVELDLSTYRGRVPVELIGKTAFPPIGALPYFITVPGYGFYWFELSLDSAAPSWHEEHLLPPELPLLVLFDGLQSLFPDDVDSLRKEMAKKVRTQLLSDILPVFLQRQRWFAAKSESIDRILMIDHSLFDQQKSNQLYTLLEVETQASDSQIYFLPLSLIWEDHDEERLQSLAAHTFARIRQQAHTGMLGDAFADAIFCRDIIKGMADGRTIDCVNGRIQFTSTQVYKSLATEDINEATVHLPGAESTNTTVIIGNTFFLKGYRRLQEGVNTELEVGRFLTEVAKYEHIVPVAGAMEYHGDDGSVRTLALLQGYVPNQGSGWAFALNYLRNYLDECSSVASISDGEEHSGFLNIIRTLGRRTGELHLAFITASKDLKFTPEPITQGDIEGWEQRIHTEVELTLDLLQQHLPSLPEQLRDSAENLLNNRKQLLKQVHALPYHDIQAMKTRYHGDYHLGQVLVVENDFVIIDFEGEPARALKERQSKDSPLKDVAGMLRSFNYAAYAALRQMPEQLERDKARVLSCLKTWETRTTQAFLEEYKSVVEASSIYPADSQHAQNLMTLFTLEKACYELRYELANRPDWLQIPIEGLLKLLQPD